MTRPSSEVAKWGSWLWRVVLGVALIVATVGYVEYLSVWASDRLGTMGALLGPSTIPESGWSKIGSIVHGGPAERAGLRVGDDVRPDQGAASQSIIVAHQQLPTTVDRGGQRFHTVITAEPSFGDAVVADFNAAIAVLDLLIYGFCFLLMVRGGSARAPMLLASVLFLMHFGVLPTLGLPDRFASALYYAKLIVAPLGILYLMPRFCLEISGGAPTRRFDWLVRCAAAVFATAGVYALISGVITAPLPGAGNAMILSIVLGGTLLSVAVMFFNYRRGDSVTRNRVRVVALAFCCFALRQAFSVWANALLAQGVPGAQMLGVAAVTMAFELAAVLLLVYAVLKQRLLDLSFAINRTLVYGAVSFTLLAAFGLAEWGADRLVPESWHRQSALYSAGIALLLFLSFHRVRDWFEKHVESLFFAGWQRAQADLKRFVASAGHFRQAPALCHEFAAEAERFAQGAPAALYLREDGGGFVRQCGGLDSAASYADEERAFALLAAERAPLDLAEAHSALPGAMAFPMLDQLGLAGFLLVGARPDGAHYRPDEIDNLAWATQQVGLDLQALQARELREEVASLRGQLAARRRKPPRLTAVPSAQPSAG